MIWWLACAGEPEVVDTSVDEAVTSDLVALDAPRLARRMSLDLRGVLPSEDELATVDEDPETLDELIEDWLDAPELEERLVHLLADAWWTRSEDLAATGADFGIYDELWAFDRAVGEEPLRLMARIAVDDRPWTDIVTAEGTMATELMEEAFPVDRDPGEGWQPASWTDARPAAGVLATNGLWWRYTTTSSNLNRARAAAVSRLLVCSDFLGRPVSFSDELGVEDAEEAVRTQPACLACHAGLDPIAGALFGFWWYLPESSLEVVQYHPEREHLAQDTLGVVPGWMGTEVDGLSGLGQAIAADPRFPRCQAETFASLLWTREVVEADFEVVDELVAAFEADGLRVKALLRAVLETESYRVGGYVEGTSGDERTTRMLSPAQLASSYEDLTGFRWTWNGQDRMDGDAQGFRILAGGVDGRLVRQRQWEPGLTWSLVVERLAQAAAQQVVDDMDAGTSELVSVGLSVSEAELEAEVERLVWRLFGERDDEAVALAVALWQAVEPDEGASAAWEAMIAALLRDPRMVTL